MLMVIFGAGASFDSLDDYRPRGSPHEHIRPPLADELFQKRGIFDPWIAQYPQFASVVPRLRRLAEDATLEHELELMRSEATTDAQRHIQLNAIIYYLRRIIYHCTEEWIGLTRGVTNYGWLLDRIRGWKVASGEPIRFVTFNYDEMLDRAASNALGLDLTSLDGYVARDDYKVLKLHGSTNWVRFVENQLEEGANVERSLIQLGEALRPTGDYRIVQIGPDRVGDQLIFPAIAIPVEAKSDFVCPRGHLEALKQDLPKVTRLLVVGWRGTEKHFLKLWAENTPTKLKIEIVSGSPGGATEVRENLRTSGISGNVHLSGAGFSQFMAGAELANFLSD